MMKKLLVLLGAIAILFFIAYPVLAAESIEVKDIDNHVHELSFRRINENSGVILVDYGPIFYYFRDIKYFLLKLNYSLKVKADPVEVVDSELMKIKDYWYKYELVKDHDRIILYMYKIFEDEIGLDVAIKIDASTINKLNKLMGSN